MWSCAISMPEASAGTAQSTTPRSRRAETTKKSALNASCTKCAAPDSARPLPSARASTPQSSGSQLPRASVIASDAAAPSAIRASHASAAGVRAARSANAAAQRRDERGGQRVAPDLLDERRDADHLAADAAGRFGHREPGPAELADLLPDPLVPRGPLAAVIGGVGIRRDERAQALDGQVLVEEAAREVAQQLLVFAEAEIPGRCSRHRVAYFDFGRPSTRSPRMLRWISFVAGRDRVAVRVEILDRPARAVGRRGVELVQRRARARDLDAEPRVVLRVLGAGDLHLERQAHRVVAERGHARAAHVLHHALVHDRALHERVARVRIVARAHAVAVALARERDEARNRARRGRRRPRRRPRPRRARR